MMFPTAPFQHTVALALLLWGCLGCHHQQLAPTPRPAGIVDVGGFVGKPGPIEIPATGLSLQQAIVRAGGASYQSLGANLDLSVPRSATLVRLQRGSEAWNFPLPVVELDLAGMIQLLPGDCVQLVPLSETALKIETEYSGNNFSYRVNKPLLNVKKFTSITDALATPKLFNQDTSNTILMVSRANPRNGSILEHYVLPTQSYGGYENALRTSDCGTLLEGDQLTYFSLGQLPLVQAGLLAPQIKRMMDSGIPPEACFRHLQAMQARQNR